MIPYTTEAVKLLMEGAKALAKVEGDGIRMDVSYLDRTIKETGQKIQDMEAQLKKSEIAKEWKKTFGAKMNFGSSTQLGKLLFEVLKYRSSDFTASGRYKTDEAALRSVDIPFVRDYLEIKKLQKIQTTYLQGIQREIVGGYLHPFFNLHTTRTFRSSSNSPNFQNLPVRNPELGRMVRSAFIPRPNGHLVEMDYSGIEVCIAACYHKDPRMIAYISDPTKDLHRDMAMECFALPKSEMNNPVDEEDKKRIKRIRYCGKNMFVFPQFYGDWYKDCAVSLWQAAEQLQLKLRDGTPMRKHLATKGIKSLSDFEEHLRKVENFFWNKRFPTYTKWKKDWLRAYQKNGYLITKTGFVCQGQMRRNEIINYPVQGSAFHCLLQSLIWFVRHDLKKRKMQAKVVGQIHDSIVADVPDDEMAEFVPMAKEIMTERLPERWKWINIPLTIEIEASPINGSWAEKKGIKE